MYLIRNCFFYTFFTFLAVHDTKPEPLGISWFWSAVHIHMSRSTYLCNITGLSLGFLKLQPEAKFCDRN